jgi:hypothetical protein
MKLSITNKVIIITMTAVITIVASYIAYTIVGVMNGSERCFLIRNTGTHPAKIFYHYKDNDYACTAILYPGQEDCIGNEE